MNWFANLHRDRPALLRGIAVAIMALALVGLVQVRFDSDPRVMFRTNDASFARLEQFQAEFSPDDQDIVVLINGQDFFTIPAITALRGFTNELQEDADIKAVTSLLSTRRPGPFPLPIIPLGELDAERLERARTYADESPVVRGHFLSDDGHATLVSLLLNGHDIDVEQLETIDRRVRAAAEKHLVPAGLRFAMAGHPPLRIAMLKTLRSEVLKFAAIGAVISGIISLVVFRNISAVLIALICPGIGVLWTVGLMGWLGIPIDPLLVVLPTLLFTVGFTDSVHLIYDIRHSLAEGQTRQAAAVAAVRHIGPACLLTVLTTMAGFGSLIVAQTFCVKRFGAACAFGSGVTFVAIQLLLPLLVSSPWGEWLRGGTRTKSASWTGGSLYRRLLRYPRLIAGISLAVTAYCSWTSLDLESDLRWLETLPRDSELVEVTGQVDRQFGGAMFIYPIVEWSPELNLDSPEVDGAIRDIHEAIDKQELLRNPLSIVSLVDSISRPDEVVDSARKLERVPAAMLRLLYRPDLRKTAISVHVPDVGAARLAPEFAKLEEQLRKIEQAHPGVKISLTGTVMVAAHNVYRIIGDLGWSLTLASGIIFAMMTLVFRSLFLGILTVIPNIFPQAITAALLVWWGEPLTITTVLTFSLCLGLSVDDTVHFLLRYQEERKAGRSAYDAALHAFSIAGSPMLATSLVLIGGFAAMTISVMPGVQQFATLCCVTLISALVGDLVMLPAILLCFPRFAAPEPVNEEEKAEVTKATKS